MTVAQALLPDRPLHRALFLHAHPDDEALATGGLIATLAASGIECQVVTCTRGERGEVIPGVLPDDARPDDLVRLRQAELAGSCAELGVSRHAYLGTPPALAAGRTPRTYRDSGMRWVTPTLAGPSLDAGPDALTSAPAAEAVADCVAVIGAWVPDVLVSYDLGGGYGHPDHVRTAEIALAAAPRAGVPLVQVVTGTPDDATWVDVSAQLSRVRRALCDYASHLSVHDDHVVHVGGQHQPIDVRTGLRAVVA